MIGKVRRKEEKGGMEDRKARKRSRSERRLRIRKKKKGHRTSGNHYSLYSNQI